MPLPEGNPTWPPTSEDHARKLYRKWGAWYSGEPGALIDVYADTLSASLLPDPKGYTDLSNGPGARVAQQRMWWGQAAIPGGLQEAKLHIPLAGDIAATSSDLLFGEPPALKLEAEAGQERLDRLVEEAGIHSMLLEAGEICAALGGVYLRVGWDEQVAEHPLFDAIPPDAAVPEWRSGHLTAVTFWRVLDDTTDVWRHLERHEPGVIFHGLYKGTQDKLGQRMDLAERPETAAFADIVGVSGQVDTGADGLAVEYVPNMRPNRTMRGSPLGRSDYAGIEGLMDALDEAWSSWMRDLRLGKARLVVPDVYLENHGRGKGASFDPEQAIFLAVSSLPATEGLSIEQVQFGIRVTEHQQTCAELTAHTVRGAGYSAQTFGDSGEAMATATEVVARERRSYTTRARKINYWRSPLIRLFTTALQIDAAHFKADGVKAEPPTLEWPDGVATDPEALGRTLQLLAAAEAVSTRTKVVMLHPDWDDDAIDEEVDAIGEDKAAGMPVPPGADPDDPFGESAEKGKPGEPGKPGDEKPPAKPASKAAPGRAFGKASGSKPRGPR